MQHKWRIVEREPFPLFGLARQVSSLNALLHARFDTDRGIMPISQRCLSKKRQRPPNLGGEPLEGRADRRYHSS
jgi:hypothetical protein